MILVVDSSALALMINPGANPPNDPTTNAPVVKARERVDAFVTSFGASDTLIVPTPTLAEVLVHAEDDGPAFLEQVNSYSRVRVKPFDQRAAVELAAITRNAKLDGDKRSGSTAAWQKVKLDRQIVAIAVVARATHLYTDDSNMAAFGRTAGLTVISTWDLSIPDEKLDLFSYQPEAEGGGDDPTA